MCSHARKPLLVFRTLLLTFSYAICYRINNIPLRRGKCPPYNKNLIEISHLFKINKGKLTKFCILKIILSLFCKWKYYFKMNIN